MSTIISMVRWDSSSIPTRTSGRSSQTITSGYGAGSTGDGFPSTVKFYRPGTADFYSTMLSTLEFIMRPTEAEIRHRLLEFAIVLAGAYALAISNTIANSKRRSLISAGVGLIIISNIEGHHAVKIGRPWPVINY